jgi:hypothetical protein
MCSRKALNAVIYSWDVHVQPTAHVPLRNILQHQVLSYCTCTSQEYITASSPFLLHMYFSGIYHCIECFPTAHIHPINILHHQVLSYCTCTFVCNIVWDKLIGGKTLYSWGVHVQSESC